MNIRSRPVPLSRPWLRLCAAVALGVLLAAGLLTSCRSAPQDAKATASVATARTSITTADGITAVTPPDETPLSVGRLDAAAGAMPKTGLQLPDRPPPPPTEALPEDYPSRLITGIKDAEAKLPVKFNFDAVPISDVVQMFADQLKFSYLIDPAVKGVVTMTMDSELTAREVWDMFEHILWLSGGYASRNPGFIHILPLSKMPQERRMFAKHPPQPNVEVAMLHVYYGKSAEVLANLKPFLSEGAALTDMPRLNSLLVVDSPVNMAKIRELVTRLDDRGEAAWPMKCVPCLVVDAEVLRDELWMLLPILGLPVTDKASTGGEIKITAMPRLQVLVVSAALPEVVAEVERWIRLLDQENAAEQQSIFFYNVRHSTADHLTEALGTFFNTTGTTSTGAAPTTKSTSSKAARAGTETGIPSMTNTASPSAPRSPGSKSSGTKREPTEAKTVFDVPVTVFTDTDQNRLTVLTSPRVYVMVEALLKRLDIPPRQVLIQATLAEITLNKDMEYGFSYAALTRFKGKDIAWALPNGNPVLNSAGAIIANPNTTNGGSLVFHSTVPTTGPPDNIGFIKAVAGEENTHVLATPQILATNDKEAIINVGDRVPIITGDTTDVSATGGTTGTSQNLYRSVQYVDTGNILTVTPHITAGNEVRLEIKQESSNAFKGESSGIDSPTIRTRTLQTECVVPDGGSVMMAGMIRTEKADSHSGVPFLKDIPWVGWLFRSNVKKDWRTEILVIVSVRVVEPTSDVDKLAQRYQVALKDIREQARK